MEKAVNIMEKLSCGCQHDLDAIKAALENKAHLAEAGIDDEDAIKQAHHIVCGAIQYFGGDFPAAPYYATCSKTMEMMAFDTKKEAEEWSKEMEMQFPCGYRDAGMPPAVFGWEFIVQNALGM